MVFISASQHPVSESARNKLLTIRDVFAQQGTLDSELQIDLNTF